MNQLGLIAQELDDGRKLLAALAQDGFPVTAVGWIKTSDDGQWFFYIATPLVDQQGPIKAYSRLHGLYHQLPRPFWVDFFEIKLIGPSEPIAEAAREVQQQYPGADLIPYRDDHLGGVSIEGAYVYPAP